MGFFVFSFSLLLSIEKQDKAGQDMLVSRDVFTISPENTAFFGLNILQ